MKIVAVIPIKGASQRIENKNLYKVQGKTLAEMVCEKVLRCKFIDEVYLDTESDKVVLHVEHLFKEGLKLLPRPQEFADNNTGANEMLVYAMHGIEDCDLILQTFATSPLISTETIDRCIEQFLANGNSHDSFFTVNEVQEYFWDKANQPTNFSVEKLPNSFELNPLYRETHGLYGIYTQTLLELKTRVGRNPMLIPIPKKEGFDIDDYEDLDIAESLLLGSKKPLCVG